MTAGPENRWVNRGSDASVAKILRDSGNEALSTIATGVEGGLPAAINAAAMVAAWPAAM